MKAENRRAWKALKKAGLEHSKEVESVKQRRRLLLRKHNRLRSKIDKLSRRNAERKFWKDPMDYTRKLFAEQNKKGKPAFGKDVTEAYLSKTYSDESRSHQFEPSQGLERPPAPTFPFSTEDRTWERINQVVKKKKNGAKAGPNSLNCVIYKKLPSVLWKLIQICKRVDASSMGQGFYDSVGKIQRS